MNAVEQREYIACLESDLRRSDIELQQCQEACACKIQSAEAYADMRVEESDKRAKLYVAKANCFNDDAKRSRRMFAIAAVALSLSVAFNVFLVVARGWISVLLRACPILGFAIVLGFPIFAEDENVRRVPPPVCTTVDIPTMKYAVPVPVANDFIRMTRVYVVTLSYYDGRSRHTQIKMTLAPQSQTQQLITEPTSVVFDVPVTFTNKRVTIERTIVDSTETQP